MATKKTSSQVSHGERKQQAAAKATKAKSAKPAKGPTTKASAASVSAFLSALGADTAADCAQVDAWMREATKAPGVMYGKSIVGYGVTTIRYADGREAPWFKIGFSPRTQALTLYGVLGDGASAVLPKLGKHSTGKGCLYIKRLSDVDLAVLKQLIAIAARS